MESFSSMEHAEMMQMRLVGLGVMEDGAGVAGTAGTNSRRDRGDEQSQSGWGRPPESTVRVRMFHNSDHCWEGTTTERAKEAENQGRCRKAPGDSPWPNPGGAPPTPLRSWAQICHRPFPWVAVGGLLMPRVSGEEGSTRARLHQCCRHFNLTTMREKSCRRSVSVKLLPLRSVRTNAIW